MVLASMASMAGWKLDGNWVMPMTSVSALAE